SNEKEISRGRVSWQGCDDHSIRGRRLHRLVRPYGETTAYQAKPCIELRSCPTRQIRRADGKNLLDYVTRRFNASSAGLKKPVGLDLRWARRFTRFQETNWSPESAEGRPLFKRLV